MPRRPTIYSYSARTTFGLFNQICNDDKIQWFDKPYGACQKTQRSKYRKTILNILELLTGYDVISFINDILTPYDVAKHIYPANKVKKCNIPDISIIIMYKFITRSLMT